MEFPSFDCRVGCSDCCGPVPFSRAEWQGVALVAASRGILVERLGDVFYPQPDEDLRCPFLEAGRCIVYEQRPYLCRVFGAGDDPRLRCAHGCGPKDPLPKAVTDRMTADYLAVE